VHLVGFVIRIYIRRLEDPKISHGCVDFFFAYRSVLCSRISQLFPVMYERILLIFCRVKLNYFSFITKTFIARQIPGKCKS